MRRTRIRWLAAALAALCWNLGLAAVVRAQSTSAVITGNLVDSNGGVLPGVTVTATNDQTGLVRTVVTGERGAYQLNALPPGTYTVTAELPGFAAERQPSVVLAIGARVTLNVTLSPATVTETVTVTGEAPLIDTTTSKIGASIAPRDVDRLPLVGRQFMDLANLAPGVSIDNTSASAASDNVAFGGFSEGFKSVWLEGMDVNDEDTRGGTGLSNSSRHTFTQESVQEFQVLSTGYSVEFGRSATGAINILTKSGTNDLRGRAFYFLRDSTFGKPNAFSHGKPPFREQQSGGTVGGPIRRDRMWFFGTYENHYLNGQATVIIPEFVRPIITDARTDIVQPVRENNLFGKVTTSLSPTQYLNVIGLYGRQTLNNQDIGGAVAGDGGSNKQQHDSFVNAALTSVFSNTVTNELKVAVSNATKSRPPNGPLHPRVIFPSFQYGTGRGFFQGRVQKNLTFMDTLNLHRETGWGTHDIKLGGEWNIVQEVDRDDRDVHGAFTFLSDRIPVAGQPSTYPVAFTIRVGSLPIKLDLTTYHGFVEDAWRPARNVTITAGVRYDLALTSDNDGEDIPTDMSTEEFLVQFVAGTLPHVNQYKTQPTDFGGVQPRVSLAWDPTGEGRTVVRSAFGLYFDSRRTATDDGVIDNYPWGSARTYANDVRVTGVPNLFFPTVPDLSTLPSAASTSVTVPNPAGGKIFRTEQASIGVNQQLGARTSLSVDYIRILGLHFPMAYNVNARLPNGQYPLIPSGITVQMIDPSGRVHSNQVQVALNQRLASRLSFQTSYTYLRFFQHQSSPIDKQDKFRDNYGPGPNDVRHRFVFSGTYGLPLDFELSGIVTANSAPPYNVITGEDANGDRDVNERPIVDGRTIPPFSARGDSYFRTDMRISRRFRFGERSLEVLWEMSNLFNTGNYGGYIGNMRSTSFGQPTFAQAPFRGQIGARLEF